MTKTYKEEEESRSALLCQRAALLSCATALQGIHATAQTAIIQVIGTAASTSPRCRSPPLVYGGIPLLLLGPLIGAPQWDVDQVRGVLHRQLIPALM